MNVAQIAGLLSRGARITYEQYLRDVLAPAHMRGPWSQKWLGTFGAFAELFWQGAQRAVDVGFPETAPDDALDEVGFNENIERLVDEPNGNYRNRLLHPFDTWDASGRIADNIQAQLEAYGLRNVAVFDLAAGWDPGDGNTYSFNRFWITAEPPTGWTLTDTDRQNIRRLVHKWRSKHSAPVSLYLILDGELAELSCAAADAMVTAGDAEEIPITAPWADDGLIAADGLKAGFYIDPI
ncbi:hypothetical protein [Sorangium sp. So ce388]|uniref:hypothetical protein n=1 Tax=Sorangium sp. So ce388 TaxID=3133309 RepID=UPI003F5B31E2